MVPLGAVAATIPPRTSFLARLLIAKRGERKFVMRQQCGFFNNIGFTGYRGHLLKRTFFQVRKWLIVVEGGGIHQTNHTSWIFLLPYSIVPGHL
jgi:hypothetical protein